MRINIDKLTEAELTDLNRRIVERLRFLDKERAQGQMQQFAIGDRVRFEPETGPPIVGIVTRYNKMTLSILADNRRRWNVSPTLVSKAPPAQGPTPGGSKAARGK